MPEVKVIETVAVDEAGRTTRSFEVHDCPVHGKEAAVSVDGGPASCHSCLRVEPAPHYLQEEK